MRAFWWSTTIAEVVGDHLRDAGLEPRHAADGPSALALAEAWQPDIVVLDLMLDEQFDAWVTGPDPGPPVGDRRRSRKTERRQKLRYRSGRYLGVRRL